MINNKTLDIYQLVIAVKITSDILY